MLTRWATVLGGGISIWTSKRPGLNKAVKHMQDVHAENVNVSSHDLKIWAHELKNLLPGSTRLLLFVSPITW